MDPLIGNEYCCAISPPAAPEFCLHIALFYRRCRRTRALATPAPPPSPQQNRRLPVATAQPSNSNYTVYRLIYGPDSRPRHRFFVQTTVVGSGRGLYLYIDEGSSGYSESPGEDPLLQHPSSSPSHSLRAKMLVGTISPHNLERFRHLCRRLAPSDAARETVELCSYDWIQEAIAHGVAEGIIDVGLRPRLIGFKGSFKDVYG
ncbi:hypothetical protein L249_8194 [Ophiocordyceps polyrhachis-furcata BCC 54312]|uniref:Uncharacterized protein n=1 Tax=Ophiocordyceps polyrhachis-furcata BCC 54312 TaxID=1330021 RepID=A0A367LIE1_9HYPO|nr:hypothetical protein L249_8194 [Ophiocordyceps polyrhachis-furcata BCC 54312]